MVTAAEITEKKWIKATGDIHKIDKHGEGVCAWCHKKDRVDYRNLDACLQCGKRMGESVAAFYNVRTKGYCDFCGDYCSVEFARNIATVNILLCHRCHTKCVTVSAKRLNREGHHKINPFWKELRRQQGKDYMTLTGFNEPVPDGLDLAKTYWAKRKYRNGN